MADLKISQLAALAGANLATADELAIVDSSASETKKITVTDLVGNATTLIADATIPGAKILFGAGGISGASIADAGISTAKVADDAITAAKLGNESTVDLVTTLPGAGAFTGQIALDTDDNKIYIWDGSAWRSVKGAGSVNVVNGNTTGILNVTVTTVGDTVTITPSFDNTTAAAQFLGGPTGGTGVVGYRAIVGTDLPTPTTSAKGGVIVNGEGLRMDGDTIEVDNDVTANSSTYQAVQFDSKGLITAGRDITAADLPAATSGAVGAIKPGTGLTMGAAGALNHTNALTGATATKVTFDAQGHVSASSALIAADIPDLDTAKITTGTFATDQIADNAITGAKIGDKATATIASTTPAGGEFIGQYHFNSLNRELFLWDGNVWQPIGISVGEIILSGTFDASAGGGTGLVASVTAEGTAVGLVVGQALPAAAATNSNYYLVVSDLGTITSGNAPNVALAPPDFILSNGSSWTKIDVSDTVVAQQATNVSFTPAGDLSATNVQAALEELDTEKIGAANPTFTGNVTISTAGTLILEGATANAFETTLSVTDPTADRAIVFPNVSGNVVTTGDTGTVTSLMITDGAIVDADINANAEIAVSKLVDGTARQLLQTDAAGTGVEWTSNIDIPGTLDVTGAATLDSTLVVTSNANAASFIPTGSTVPTNGVYLPAANTLAFATNTSERIRIGASGQIGLAGANYGTSGQVLTSGGSGGVPTWTTPAAGSPDSISEGNTSAEVIDTGTDGRFVVTTEGSEAMRIDSSGRLLVGTSSALTGTNSANGILTIKGYPGGATSAAIFNLARGLNSASVSSGNTLGRIVFADQQAGEYALIEGECDGTPGSGDYPGRLVFSTTADGASSPTERLRIDSSGNAIFAADASINSLTIGRGGGNSAYNTAVGDNVLQSNTTGTVNTGLGANALLSLTEGNRNTALGYNALRSCTTATNNTAVGVDALYAATTGAQQGNTAVGDQSGRYLTTGSRNVAVGYFALFSSTTSSNNTALGGSALYSNTTGSQNAVNGYAALQNNTTGGSNVAVGFKALLSNTTAYFNTAIGTTALYTNTTGTGNVATGGEALYNNTTGNNNVANGLEALRANTTGASNIATGQRALYSNTTGIDNVANGKHALYYNTTGSNNVAVGLSALKANTGGGSNNTALGNYALKNNTTGSANIQIGGLNSAASYVPVFNVTTESNRLVLGHTGISNAYVQVAWTVTSDERDKMNFAPVPHGLDFVNQLKPTAYQFKVDRDTETPNGDVRYGFKAQDILALEGDNPVIIDTEDADHLKYKGEHLVPVLVNAVQELTAMVNELKAEVAALKGA